MKTRFESNSSASVAPTAIQQGSLAGDAAAPQVSAPVISAAQSPCPAINFQTALQLTDSNSSEFFGMQRQADGSFTEQTYVVNTAAQSATKTGSVPNIQLGFVNCSGLPARTRKLVAPSIKTDPLGTPSRNPVWVDLAGDGVGAPGRRPLLQ